MSILLENIPITYGHIELEAPSLKFVTFETSQLPIGCYQTIRYRVAKDRRL